MENSIEEKILKLQQNKAALNKGALTKLTPAELAAARRAEIKSLFEL
jgi:SNF2 family DNA or RNA helicase